MLNRGSRMYHTVASPAANATETPVLVYDSKEYKSLERISGRGGFAGQIGSTDAKAKTYSLLPFLFEATFTPKSFVLRMQLYPKAGLLQMDTLQFSGVETTYVPVDQMIPISKYDYWCAPVWRPFFKQNQCLDLDMVYANSNTKEMFVFDKEGEWHDDGVYHEALSMDSTYNETQWYDEFTPHNFM